MKTCVLAKCPHKGCASHEGCGAQSLLRRAQGGGVVVHINGNPTLERLRKAGLVSVSVIDQRLGRVTARGVSQ